MSRVLACPYSETIRHEKNESSDAAKWGQEVHKWMETRGAYRPGPVGELDEKGAPEYDWSKKEKYCKNLNDAAAEAFGWNDPKMRYEVNVLRYDTGATDEHYGPDWEWRDRRADPGVLMSGTVDMLKVDPVSGVVTIRDLKTGTVCPQVVDNKQLLAYAACAPLPAREFDPIGGLPPWAFSLEIVHWPYKPYKGEPETHVWNVDAGAVSDFIRSVRRIRLQIENDAWSLSPNVGEHCAFCPGKKNCEGWK